MRRHDIPRLEMGAGTSLRAERYSWLKVEIMSTHARSRSWTVLGTNTPTRTVSRGADAVILICAFGQGCDRDGYLEPVGVNVYVCQ